MKFYLVDHIESLIPGERIVTIKCLTAAEEYLADHFPAFPVMPGVLMLEACVQSAAWLVRIMSDWSVSMVVLRRAQNVRYGNFVAPGDTLRIEAELVKHQGEAFTFKCVGAVDKTTALQAKIELKAFNLADTDPALAGADAEIIAQMKQRFDLCRGNPSA
ncbi:MAG: beta-hydroxyacyl-ACP dehydratase [Planctomycetes bacterium]|nr:beta-hydroxyacyl-ACP dehydratase [Planctomycetota bacterium]